jgi:hypothetical protein
MPMTTRDLLALAAEEPQAFSAAQIAEAAREAGTQAAEAADALRRLSNLIDTAQRNGWVQATVRWTPAAPWLIDTAYVLGLTAAGKRQLELWRETPG